MASAMLSGAESLRLIRGITPNGLGFKGSDFHGRHFPKLGLVSSTRISKDRTMVPMCSVSNSWPASQPRFIQHKQEAFWLYRFLSIVFGWSIVGFVFVFLGLWFLVFNFEIFKYRLVFLVFLFNIPLHLNSCEFWFWFFFI